MIRYDLVFFGARLIPMTKEIAIERPVFTERPRDLNFHLMSFYYVDYD